MERSESTPEIPDDIEARYKELQEEISKIEISPTIKDGESREERFERRQRLRAYRKEFDTMVRPRRQRPQTTTVIALLGIVALLCALSVGGGALLSGYLNQPDDVTNVATPFWNQMKGQSYAIAWGYVDPGTMNLQDFQARAGEADAAMGIIVKAVIKPGTVITTGSSVRTQNLTFLVSRGGGEYNSSTIEAGTYSVSLHFSYNADTGGWRITSLGQLFQIQTGGSTAPPPDETPTATS